MLYEDGRHQMVSVASNEWRRDAGEALGLFVRHLEDTFGNRILGYHIGAQSAGEWFYDGSWTPTLPNFETPFRTGFRAWLKEKYRTREALRSGWQDPRADFASVELPSAAARRDGRDGSFRDPITQRTVIDFFEYSQVAIVEALEQFARVVKREVRGTKLVFAFYGYLFEVAGFGNGPQVSGHLLTDRVARCPDIDVICAPIAYFDRDAGGSAPFMAPVDSIQRRGKLWLNEDDTRTHLSAPGDGTGRVDTLTATLSAHQRNFAQVLAHRCGIWWMDLPARGWLASRELWDNFATLRELRRADADESLRPDVAVLVDERSMLYQPCNNVVTAPLLAQLRHHIHRAGVSVGYYLLDHLGVGLVPDAKLYLLLNAFVVNPGERQAIHRAVRNRGKWAMWFYAPGYLDPTGSAGDMSALTGLPLRRLPTPQALRVTMVPGSFATTGVPADQLTFGEDTPRAPAFSVGEDAEEVLVLGHYARTRTPAVASVRRAEWSSVFVASTTISTGALRAIARAAGAHVWLESDDVVITGSDVVAVHASTTGDKELLVPAGMAIRNVSAGATSHTGRVKLMMRRGETKLFRVIRP